MSDTPTTDAFHAGYQGGNDWAEYRRAIRFAGELEKALRLVRDVVKNQQIAHQVIDMESGKSLLEYLNEQLRDAASLPGSKGGEMKKGPIIKKGQIVAISTGEYSDYSVREYVRALRDIDRDAEAKRFKETGPFLAPPTWDEKGDPDEYGSDDRFIAWAIKEGMWEPLEAELLTEWWIGAYGRFGDH